MKTKIFILSLVVWSVFSTSELWSQNAKSILAKMDQVMFFPKDKQYEADLIIENLKNGKITEKKAEIFEKNNKKLFRYTAPKSDSGIASLTLSDNEVYIYLPVFNMVKKITTSSSIGNMNKSDFALADRPEKSYSDSYTPTLIKTTDQYYELKLVPKKEKIPYGYLLVKVDKKNFYPKEIVYFDKKGNKLKTATYHFMKLNGHWVADKIEMKNAQKQSRTTIKMHNIKINKGIPDAFFTKEHLKKKKNK